MLGQFQIWRQNTTWPSPCPKDSSQCEYCPEKNLVIGDTVELKYDPEAGPKDARLDYLTDNSNRQTAAAYEGTRGGDFLRIVNILVDDEDGEVRLRGFRLRRTSRNSDLMPDALNDVFVIAAFHSEGEGDNLVQALEEISMDEVENDPSEPRMPLRRRVHITNALHPKFSFRDRSLPTWFGLDENDASDPTISQLSVFASNQEVLTCRWIFWTDTDTKMKNVYSLTRITADQADRVNPRRETWGLVAQSLSRGGPTDVHLHDYGSIDCRVSPRDLAQTFLGRGFEISDPFTFADCFCGAGGCSSGARQARLKVLWGVDYDDRASETYRMNFPEAGLYNEDFSDFIQRRFGTGRDGRVKRATVLHMSPPCQTFSPANTLAMRRDPNSRGAQRDEANHTAFYSAADIVKAVLPMIVTMEQTDGVAKLRMHKPDLRRFVRTVAEVGYSVHMVVVNMLRYGVPQQRKRVIVIASCPGITIPPFPPETHSEGGGGDGIRNMEPFVTINKALNINLPGGDRILKNIITTGGTTEQHPAGRPFTTQDLQKLCTFPDSFRFPGGHNMGDTRRQLGNAVPPHFAKALYRSIAASLREQTRWWRSAGAGSGGDGGDGGNGGSRASGRDNGTSRASASNHVDIHDSSSDNDDDDDQPTPHTSYTPTRRMAQSIATPSRLMAQRTVTPSSREAWREAHRRGGRDQVQRARNSSTRRPVTLSPERESSRSVEIEMIDASSGSSGSSTPTLEAQTRRGAARGTRANPHVLD